MKHTLTVTDQQLNILRDLLEERLEDIDEEITFYTENPKALEEDAAEGETLSIEDYEDYRDEVQTLLDNMPEPNED
jgi:oligoendopeptidase F